MREVGVDQRLELGDELVDALGRQIEPEQLDRDEPVLVGVVAHGIPDRARLRRSGEEREMDRMPQDARRRQLPCAVRCSSSEVERRALSVR